MTTGPDEEATAGRGHLRAAHADREHTIAALKAAFVQGRLNKDELDARAGQAFASRTYAELAALTADLPDRPADTEPFITGLAIAGPAITGPDVAGLADTWLADPGPRSTPARTLARAARRSGICVLAAVVLTEGAFLAQSFPLLVLAFFAVIAASGFLGYGVVDAVQDRRSLRSGRNRRRPSPPGIPAASGTG
ncbi:MAG TPA: DUF1707 domain-containing protein [Streptosporangiaceae bacterium]|nr:DUF1707 domain-containing protein [Streptosporangiaceae bacterium]